MLRVAVVAVILFASRAHADTFRCDNLSTADLNVDGLLDDWPHAIVSRTGSPDGGIALRCSWDGTALALALDITDDRVVRIKSGRAHEDHVTIAVAAGGRPVAIDAYPGNALAKPRIAAPRGVAVADSLQPRGFSVEARIPGSALAGLSPGTAALSLRIVFHDSDAAAGGKDHDVELAGEIELGDRKDLLDDFLRTVKLTRAQLKTDTLAELDLARRGKERLVAGGTVIGVLGEEFAYVALPVARPTDVLRVELLPLGPRGQQVIAAVVRQSGGGGTRDLLMMWTVIGGALQPLGQIEIRKQLGANTLESHYRVVAGRARELWVEPQPAIGWTAETWNEEPAEDADSIVAPWEKRGGIAYGFTGAELTRRDLPRRR
ncbi:MAG TPA: hypothetical protein VGM88_28180 [Kofleriaceae bacterium]|jgi:hypothetical protein